MGGFLGGGGSSGHQQGKRGDGGLGGRDPWKKEKRKEAWLSSKASAEQCFSVVSLLYYGSADVVGHATVAANVVSIELRAQLLLVDSPLPTFFCFISCSVFVADSS